MACRALLKNKTPGARTSGPGMNASAFHGRQGAQVALLQSPILPTARSLYIRNQIFRGPVDKPHTCRLAVCICSASDTLTRIPKMISFFLWAGPSRRTSSVPHVTSGPNQLWKNQSYFWSLLAYWSWPDVPRLTGLKPPHASRSPPGRLALRASGVTGATS